MATNDEARLIDALREFANAKEARADDEAVVDSVLARYAEDERTQGLRKTLIGITAGVLVTAAAITLSVLGPAMGDASVSDVAVAPVPEPTSGKTGFVVVPEASPLVAVADDNLWIEARGDRACVDTPTGASLCVEPGSRVPVDPDTLGPAPVVLSVIIGSVDVTTIDGVTHRLDRGDSFDVARGVVMPTRADRAAKSRVKSVADPGPNDLLATALAHRKAGRIEDASAAFRKLIGEHPGSRAARIGMMSLGQLELGEMRRPKAALELFNRYLETGGGVLGEEALYQRTRALRMLGRSAQEREAIEQYLSTHPNGAYAALLSKRRSALRK